MTAQRERCETCRWWRYMTTKTGRTDRPVPIGACRRFPPTITMNNNGKIASRNPTTCGHDYCGEWKERDDGGAA